MSSFTIESILRQSDEPQCSSTSGLDFEQFHDVNRRRPAEIPTCTNYSKRSPLIFFSNAYDNRLNTPHCESTSWCNDMEKKGCKRFCNAASYGKQRNSFNITSLLHGRCCCLTRFCNYTETGTGECKKCMTESCKKYLRSSLILDQNASSGGRYLAQRPIPILCGNSLAVENENEVRAKQKKTDVEYDWMVNPRPFYRKDGKKQKQADSVLKRDRITFDMRQRAELERQFQLMRYPSRYHRSKLARSLELSEFQVKVWFQNRRMKFKRWKNAEKHLDIDVPSCYCRHVDNEFH